MISELNKKIVNDTFNNAYSEERFKKFIMDLLPSANYSEEKARYFQIPNDFKDFIRSTKRICKYKYASEEYVDEKVIDVLVVKLKKTTSIERARVAQRNYIARYLDKSRDYLKDAALVAFISEDENGNILPDWRFSFVQMNWESKIVEGANGKKRITEKQLTPAKRFSFLVGENEDTHTAQTQLGACLEKSSKGESITVEDLVQAFDIEKVSKEFFDKYKALYIKLRDELRRLCDEDKLVNKDFTEHNISIDDFAKKTLGQLVFLYFIQKKGWLGVKKDAVWGTGDKKFLRNVFDGKYCKYNNFFNDILEHLFYEALACDRKYNNFEFDRLNCRIPFLNGGLFEPVNGYEWTKTDLTIDNVIFKEIFDTFDLFNFTVKEDEPLEKEVAIDPEMLGKVFENLLPENIRKGNGAFYTPREIVHYMCQESLINYLYNKINIKEVPLTEEEKNKQLSLLKTKKEKGQLKLTREVVDEIISKEDIEFLVKTGNSTYINKTRGINIVLPDSIKQNATLIDDALLDIKVCDPAIGSGAFPVGMMNEIVRARATLSEFINSNRSIYELKRNAIENSIYGVDIDAGAVDIAKLRFWLSLVVDEEDIKNIKPLPNLDYKIMQGNSLVTSYEGIDFDEIVDSQQEFKQLDLFASASEKITNIISDKQKAFLNTPYPSEKCQIKQEIEDLIVELVKTKFEEKAEKEGKSKDFYEEQIRNFAQNKEKRAFFPWKLFFADAFENGGFDIVIGNPPYLESRSPEYTDEMKDKNLDSVKKRWGEKSIFFTRGCDLLIFFFELSLYLIKNNGINAFITQNSWLDTEYGKKFQEFLSNNTEILGIVDSDYKYFDNKEGPNINTIITFFKGKKNITNLLKFACYHVNFAENTISLHNLSTANNNSLVTYKEYNLLDDETKCIKWGTLLYSTSVFLNILKIMFDKGVRIEKLKKVKIGQGLNISKALIVTDLDVKQYNIEQNVLIPFFTKQANFEINNIETYLIDESKLNKEKRSELESVGYVFYSSQKTSKKPPKLIMPRGIGRHFCAINQISAYSDSCVDIYDDSNNLSNEQLLNLWCFLNSSVAWLLREISGRKNLGGGMLKAEAVDLKAFPILYEFNAITEIQNIKEIINKRDVLDTLTEINTEEHKKIDKIVFDYLELNEYEREYVLSELKSKILSRSQKSKT